MGSAIDYLNSPDASVSNPLSAQDYLNAPDAPAPLSWGERFAQFIAKTVPGGGAGTAPYSPSPPEVPQYIPDFNATPNADAAMAYMNPPTSINAPPNGPMGHIPDPMAQGVINQVKGEDTAEQAATLKSFHDAVNKIFGAGTAIDTQHGYNYAPGRALMGVIPDEFDKTKWIQNNLPGTTAGAINIPGKGNTPVFQTPDGVVHPYNGTEDTWGKAGDVASKLPALMAQGAALAFPEMRAEALASKMYPWIPAKQLIADAIVQGGAGAAERAAELESLRAGGYNSESAKADAGQIALGAAVPAAGTIAGTMVSRLGRMIEGTAPGYLNMGSDWADRQAAEKYIGANINPDVSNSLRIWNTDSKVLQVKASLLGAMNNALSKGQTAQAQLYADTLDRMAARANAGSSTGIPTTSDDLLAPGIGDVHNQMEGEALAPVEHITETSPVAGGRSIGNIFSNAVKPVVGRTAANTQEALAASASERPNLAPIQQKIAEIAQGKHFEGLPDEEGNPTTFQYGGIAPAIEPQLTALSKLNPNPSEVTPPGAVSPVEALTTLKSPLSAASKVAGTPDLAANAAGAQARQILPLVKDAASTPALRAAANNKGFEASVLDTQRAQAAKNAEEPAHNMSLFTTQNPSFVTNAQRLANATGQSAEYENAQNAAKTALIRNPADIDAWNRTAAADPATAARIIPAEDQAAITQYGKNVAQVAGSLPAKMAAETDPAARAALAFNGASAAPAKDLADLIRRGGGTQSPIGQNLRAGLIQSVITKGADGLPDIGKTLANVRGIIDDGRAAAVLTPEELTGLNHMVKLGEGYTATPISDMGAQIAGRGVIQAGTNPLSIFTKEGRAHFMHGLVGIFENRVQNSTWMGPKGLRVLTQEGLPAGSIPIGAGAGGALLGQGYLQQEPTFGK